MDLLITVSNASSGEILAPLLRACVRRGCTWQVFMTHEGVKVLDRSDVTELLQSHQDSAIVCHDSWLQFNPERDCPVTVGSQTNHSEMAGRAQRIVSI